MTPLEAMARAIFSNDEDAVDDDDFMARQWEASATKPENSPPRFRREIAFAQARAALIALRECGVAEAMLGAWGGVPPEFANDLMGKHREQAEHEFRAMLDAAIKEGP
jgi:hypothetical protein